MFTASFRLIGCPGAGLPLAVRAAILVGAIGCVVAVARSGAAETPASAAEPWREVLEENRRLREQLREQQTQIADLRERLDSFAATSREQDAQLAALAERAEAAASAREAVRHEPRAGKVILSGHAGVALIAGDSDNAFPNQEFRVDEAKLFLDAELRRNTYLFGELDLTMRESNDEYFHLGEFYVEFENLAEGWGADQLVNVRVGRIDLPFGDEYQHRDVIANPLITHSLSDIWGVDEGLEIFGQLGTFSYVFAVQNGGHKTLHDYNSSKAFVARIGAAPVNWLNLSASAMTTGDIDRANDSLSEVWYGGGFFRALGAAATTTSFRADLAQLDAAVHWNGGQLKATAGWTHFDDDDTAADNRRRLRHFSLEAKQTLSRDFYGAVRYSRILTDAGYPLVGLGTFGKYFFSSLLTRDLWRLGVGLGYRARPGLLLKAEYTIERGELVNGLKRNDADQFAAEAAVSF